MSVTVSTAGIGQRAGERTAMRRIAAHTVESDNQAVLRLCDAASDAAHGPAECRM
jgi:hypothetical protein